MKTLARYLAAAALLATLAACGNKGPLVRPSAIEPTPAPIAAPPPPDPTESTPVEPVTPPPAVTPAPVTPPAAPPAGGGHG